MTQPYNTVIIGAGPAAYTAGIYTARANLHPILFEGLIPGGQLITTTIVENYPGFADGVDGYELMDSMRLQAQHAGCTLIPETVTGVDFSAVPYKIHTDAGNTVTAHTVIIATGATAKKLELPHGNDYWNRGISACAVCDGALPIFRDKPLIVIGGGDTACEEALHLAKFGSVVYVLVRSDRLRASQVMRHRVSTHPKIRIMYHTEVVDVEGTQMHHDSLCPEALANTPDFSPQLVGETRGSIRAKSEGSDGDTIVPKIITCAHVVNNETGDKAVIECGGMFYAIGHVPNTEFLGGQVKLHSNGYIDAHDTRTDIPGVYACGDVQDYIYRQAITAAGSGCMAALNAEKYLSEISQ